MDYNINFLTSPLLGIPAIFSHRVGHWPSFWLFCAAAFCGMANHGFSNQNTLFKFLDLLLMNVVLPVMVFLNARFNASHMALFVFCAFSAYIYFIGNPGRCRKIHSVTHVAFLLGGLAFVNGIEENPEPAQK